MYKTLDNHINCILKNQENNLKENFKDIKLQTAVCYKELDKHIKCILGK